MTVHETTPLIHKKKTPLPKLQFGLVLLLMFSEPISGQYIFPFVNQVSGQATCKPRRQLTGEPAVQLIRDLGITGGDDRKVGYYAGLIVSRPIQLILPDRLYFIYRSHYFTWPKHLQLCIGVAYQTMWGVNRSC